MLQRSPMGNPIINNCFTFFPQYICQINAVIQEKFPLTWSPGQNLKTPAFSIPYAPIVLFGRFAYKCGTICCLNVRQRTSSVLFSKVDFSQGQSRDIPVLWGKYVNSSKGKIQSRASRLLNLSTVSTSK